MNESQLIKLTIYHILKTNLPHANPANIIYSVHQSSNDVELLFIRKLARTQLNYFIM